MLPMMHGSGPGARTKRHERLFFGRAIPKSARLLLREGEFYLHVAFEYPPHLPRPLTGNILAVRRGIRTLVAAVVVDPAGQIIHRQSIDGKDLIRAIAAVQKARAIQEQKGRPTAGDRRAGRITAHLLYSAGHQLVDVACRFGAEIVLLRDRHARQPQRLLGFKHFSRLAEILEQLTAEAGLPSPETRPIYGPWHTCIGCGWKPGDPVRCPEASAEQCPGCGAMRDAETHLAHLLALDTMRLKNRGQKETLPLGEYLRGLRGRSPPALG
jgi:hypothetical protein